MWLRPREPRREDEEEEEMKSKETETRPHRVTDT